MRKDIWKKMLPIYATSLVAWFYVVAYIPLGYMYADFPGQDSLVMLIATIPSLAVMAASFLSAPLLNRFGPKAVVLTGLLISGVSGILITFFGRESLMLCIVASALTGVPAGFVQAANYIQLAEIAPSDMQDKVIGWCDSICAVGAVAVTALSGVLSNSGNWTNAYYVYWAVFVIFLVAVFWYPKTGNGQTVEAKGTEAPQAERTGKSVIPACIIGLILLRLFAGMFYMGYNLFMSEFVVETGACDVAYFGTAEGIAGFVGIISYAVIFFMLRKMKAATFTVGMVILGVVPILIAVTQQPLTIMAGAIIRQIGLGLAFSGASTIVTLSCEGKGLETATSLSLAAAYGGEFLAGYIPAILAGLLFGGGSATNALLISGIFCLIVAVIGLPIFAKSYKVAYGKKNADVE